MLKNVHLKNIALIEEADIDYDMGLNIMTGETGSGKSIIISSINIGLGGKADRSLIRRGCDHAMVELSFETDSVEVKRALDEIGVDAGAGEVVISRKITKDSAIARINGQTVTLPNIKRIASLLIDVHGQHDHQSLLDPSRHLDIVDRYAGTDVEKAKSAFKKLYTGYKALRSEYGNLNLDDESLKREIELLQFQKDEIEEAALMPGEDASLEEECKKLRKWEKISDSLKKAYTGICDDATGILQKISQVCLEIDYAAKENDDKDMTGLKSASADIYSIAEDLGHDLEKYIESHSFDEKRYAEIRQRLEKINKLKEKYGNTSDDILKFYDTICKKLDEYKNYSRNRKDINTKLSAMKGELNHSARELSALRQLSAGKLQEEIKKNLDDLNLLDVNFQISFDNAGRISENGYDKVEFLISLNPGEPLKPLARVASGGELSRLMLAIKTSIADNDDIQTLIFDEIDTGISGRTAQKVAWKLHYLSKAHQIICITHLPQIAAMADQHFLIEKESAEGNTLSGIRKLTYTQEIEEVARLLSGDTITAATIENAKELKYYAKNK